MIRLLPVLLTSGTLLLGAQPARLERFEAVEPAMGTLFRVTLYAASPEEARSAFAAAFARARELDSRLSDYREDSELNRLCQAGGGQASEDLFSVLEAALQVARASGGAFDPAIGELTHLWRKSIRNVQIPNRAELTAARARSGWGKVRLDKRTRTVRLPGPGGVQLDLGGIAKGFAASEMLRVLAARDLDSALVAASGDLAIGAPPPGSAGWTVSLGASATNELLAHCGVSTSGATEQFVDIGGVRYSHILDPRTGLGLTGEASRRTVTVIAPTAVLADALATMAAVAGPAKAPRVVRRWIGVRLLVH